MNEFNSFNSNPNYRSQQQFFKSEVNERVIIRRLPTNFTIEQFKIHFDPLPPHEQFYLVCNNGVGSFSRFSRAYITFINKTDIFRFQNKYDGLPITAKNGVIYTVVVELAPFQPNWISNGFNRADSIMGTVVKDKYFLNFEEIEKSKKNSIQSCFGCNVMDNSKSNTAVVTPLLKFLKEKQEKKHRICREEFYIKKHKPKCI